MSTEFHQMVVASQLLYRPEGATIEMITEALDVSRRTAYRIMDRLGQLKGFKILSSSERLAGKTVYHLIWKQISQDTYLSPIYFSKEDNILFQLLVQETSREEAFQPWLQRFIAKIDYMASKSSTAFPSISNVFVRSSYRLEEDDVPHTNCPDEEKQLIVKILDAAKGRKICTITPKPGYPAVKTALMPLCCFTYASLHYCYALSTDPREELILVVLPWVADIEVSEQEYSPRITYDVNELLDDPFGIALQKDPFIVEILMSKETAWCMKGRLWPKSMDVTEREDGSFIVRVTTRGFKGLKAWILAWGSEASVIGPDWFRMAVAQELSKVRQQY